MTIIVSCKSRRVFFWGKTLNFLLEEGLVRGGRGGRVRDPSLPPFSSSSSTIHVQPPTTHLLPFFFSNCALTGTAKACLEVSPSPFPATRMQSYQSPSGPHQHIDRPCDPIAHHQHPHQRKYPFSYPCLPSHPALILFTLRAFAISLFPAQEVRTPSRLPNEAAFDVSPLFCFAKVPRESWPLFAHPLILFIPGEPH